MFKDNDGSSHKASSAKYKRTYTWNERNQLISSVDDNYSTAYVYGQDGQRSNKYTQNSETLYFNRMWTHHTDSGNSVYGGQTAKNIYLGETRIVTKLNSGDEPTYQEEYYKQYYYHSDHLGSASLITDYRGDEYQRIEYTPYGETWVEKTSNTGLEYLPYRFTAKELDEETGLYYYGARYLDPRYSRWISTDPAVGEYIPGAGKATASDAGSLPGMGGVFNTVNFQLYHYAGNNPIRYTDPDGKFISKNNHLNRNNSQMGLAPENQNTMNFFVEIGLFTNWGNTGTHNLKGNDTVKNRINAFLGGPTGTNTDYRGVVGSVFEGCQFVYDKNGNLVTDALNKGTFDTHSPQTFGGKIAHGGDDVLTWFIWGNGDDDKLDQMIMPKETSLKINEIQALYEKNELTKEQANTRVQDIIREQLNSQNSEN